MTRAAPLSGFFHGRSEAIPAAGHKKTAPKGRLARSCSLSEDETAEEEAQRHCHGDGGHARDEEGVVEHELTNPG